MSVYVVTGKLGSGKSLIAVSRIREYLRQGRRVATNLDLYLEHMMPAHSRATVIRLPDKPRLEDLEALGTGDGRPVDEYDEGRFGLLVLDELASWMNARAWNDRSRLEVIEWFLHARKYHWDVLLLVQDIDAIDKQLRGALAEHLVVCRRLDRMVFPIVGPLIKVLTGSKMPMPKLHVATVYYGDTPQGMKVDRWWYRGTDLFRAYRTGQVFMSGHELVGGELRDMRASYTMLSAWHLRGRYLPRRSILSTPWALLEYALKSVLRWIIQAVATFQGRSPWEVAAAWGVLSREGYRRWLASRAEEVSHAG